MYDEEHLIHTNDSDSQEAIYEPDQATNTVAQTTSAAESQHAYAKLITF